MKAILMTAVGGPDVLQAAQVPIPDLAQDRDLLVRLKAAGVNPIDTKLRSRGTYFPERMPAILGCDGAGVVERVGERVSRFEPGDEVWFCNGGIGGQPGNYAEYAVIDERFASKKPSQLDFAEAAAGPLVLITAWEALFERTDTRVGQRLLIHAGAGGVGHVALQLAAGVGARVATTVSGDAKADVAIELGAELAIDYQQRDFVEAVDDWSSEAGADAVFDTVGGATFSESFRALRYGGDLVTLLQPPADTDWGEARRRNLRISLELMLTPMAGGLVEQQVRQARILDQCATLIDEGRLRIVLSHRLPLERAADAHRLLEAGGRKDHDLVGKIALEIE